jgi:hypothetical protein
VCTADDKHDMQIDRRAGEKGSDVSASHFHIVLAGLVSDALV